jgi:hypothetical protein
MLHTLVFLALLYLYCLSGQADASGQWQTGSKLKRQESERYLSDAAYQSASEYTGQEPGTPGIKPGQSPSDT